MTLQEMADMLIRFQSCREGCHNCSEAATTHAILATGHKIPLCERCVSEVQKIADSQPPGE